MFTPGMESSGRPHNSRARLPRIYRALWTCSPPCPHGPGTGGLSRRMQGALSPRGPANRAPMKRASKERLRLRSTAATRGACLSNVPRCAQAGCWGAPLPPRSTSLRREVFARSLRRVLQASAARTNRLYSCQSTRSPRLLAAVIFNISSPAASPPRVTSSLLSPCAAHQSSHTAWAPPWGAATLRQGPAYSS